MVSRTFIVWLTWLTLVLTVFVGVLGGSAALLGQMGDDAGSTWIARATVAAAILWLVSLVVLLLAVAMSVVLGAGETHSIRKDAGADEASE